MPATGPHFTLQQHQCSQPFAKRALSDGLFATMLSNHRLTICRSVGCLYTAASKQAKQAEQVICFTYAMTRQDFAGNSNWSVNIFLVANAAGHGFYDAAALQQAMQQTLPELFQHARTSQACSDTTHTLELGRTIASFQEIFRFMIRTPEDGTLYSLVPCTELGTNQPSAYQEAATYLYTAGRAVTGLEDKA